MKEPSPSPHAPKSGRLWLLAIPVALVALAVLALSWILGDRDHPRLVPGTSYELWIEEAEVAASPADGKPWDTDNSAPDLCAVVTWQDQRVLGTVTARDGLIARWDPVAVDIPDMVMKGGKADTANLKRVARVRMTEDSSIDVGVFDADPVDAAYAGGFRIPLSSLRLGRNRVEGSATLRSIMLRIEDPAQPSAPDPGKAPWRATDAVTELPSPSPAMQGAVGNLLAETIGDAKKALEDAGDDIKRSVDDLGKKAEDRVNEFLKKNFGE